MKHSSLWQKKEWYLELVLGEEYSPTSYPVNSPKPISTSLFAKPQLGDHGRMDENLWHSRAPKWVCAWIGNRFPSCQILHLPIPYRLQPPSVPSPGKLHFLLSHLSCHQQLFLQMISALVLLPLSPFFSPCALRICCCPSTFPWMITASLSRAKLWSVRYPASACYMTLLWPRNCPLPPPQLHLPHMKPSLKTRRTHSRVRCRIWPWNCY